MTKASVMSSPMTSTEQLCAGSVNMKFTIQDLHMFLFF